MFGAPNESLRLIIIYYMFKYTVGIKTTLLESLQNQKSPLKLDLGTTYQKDFVFARSDFLRLIGAQNESLRRIIIQYMFKYSCRIKTTLLESLQSQKSPLKARFS